ncbi:MAG: FG-GAP-like repeat-containing protein [Candidatus Krumholzibacteriota bacterium]
MPSTIRIAFLLIMTATLGSGICTGAAALTLDDLGGDDIPLLETLQVYNVSLDVASNGDIYMAVEYLQETSVAGINVYRSKDDGTTWDLWGQLSTPSGQSDQYRESCMDVVEGTVSRCYLAYVHDTVLIPPEIMMVSSDLSDPVADFSSPVTVMTSALDYYAYPRFDTDVDSYNQFYIYVVAERKDGTRDIVFSRSTDQGATFETPYVIGNLVPSDRGYEKPDVSYGFGNYVNVVWQFVSLDESFDSALRYTWAVNAAGAGLADWSGVHGLGSTSDAVEDIYPRIEASGTGSEVVIAHERRSSVKEATALPDPGVYVSTDNGQNFPVSTTIADGVIYLGDVVEQPGTGAWFIGGTVDSKTGIHRANVADLTSWSALETFVDQDYGAHERYLPSLAFNPVHSYQPAMAWTHYDHALDDVAYFDGAWRGDEGYPNLEPGFPVDLPHQPRSAPAVVDVDGDGDLEIVFGDTGGNIQIYQNDGTPLPGWPVNVGEPLSDSPVAVGDLQGNGEMSIVAGSTNGLVYCYDPLGQMRTGNWPYTSGAAHPAYVAIGAFGQGPYPRGIVAAIGYQGSFLDHKGWSFPGSQGKVMARLATHAPAVGDVDGDGIPEAVFANEETVVAAHVFAPTVAFGTYMPTNLSGSATLGDFDLDGDVEVVVPLEDGTLHVFQGDGSALPGFPFTSPTGYRLNTAAIGQMLGNAEPEIVVAARNWTVHLLWYDGVEGLGFPVDTTGWLNYGSPIIGRVEGPSSDVILGSRGEQAWAWDNFGGVISGWPKAADHSFYVAPAMGDIDLDGSSEIVLISTAQLLVVDINSSPNDASRTWGMAGHDPRRTGCSDCPEDLVTPVEDDLDAVTRVSFALPSPNPSSGHATFRFAVPGPAVVNLEVFDVRGHRVSLVTREEVDMGHHVVSWGGLSDRGAPLASGIYFARLRVQGPGINEELTRKIVLAR